MSTLEVGTIAPISGSNDVTLGGSSKNIKFASGTTVDFSTNTPTTTLSSTMKMTPAFRAFHNTTQNVSTATLTTLSFNSETFDSDGTYNTSNGRFTPGVAGKYVIFAHVRVDDTNSYQFEVEIRTSAENAIAKGVVVNANKNTNSVYTIADLSSDEYVFVTAYHSQGGTRTLLSGTSQAYFGGFKIIGA